MLYKIKTKSEIQALLHTLPKEVISEAGRVAEILDNCYNSQGIDGGFILIAENNFDLQTVKHEYLDYTNEIYEFKDDIGDWVSVLYLTGTEYSVTLITKSKYIDI